jgi:hypothetical protein
LELPVPLEVFLLPVADRSVELAMDLEADRSVELAMDLEDPKSPEVFLLLLPVASRLVVWATVQVDPRYLEVLLTVDHRLD